MSWLPNILRNRIINFSCGRNLKYKRSRTTMQKTNCDFISILGFSHSEEFQSRTKTRCFWTTDHVLQGGTHKKTMLANKSPTCTRNFFDSDKNLPMHQHNAWKCKHAHLAGTEQTLGPIRPQHRRWRKLEGLCSLLDLDGGITESHGETRRQHLHLHLHLQLRSGRFRNGKHIISSEKWWWVRFLGMNFRKSTWSVDSTPNHRAHVSSAVCSQARNASHALGSRIAVSSLCAWKESVIGSAHFHFCCFLTCRLPRVHHLLHSLFFLLRDQNTHCNRDNTIISKNTQYVISLSRISQSTSSAI